MRYFLALLAVVVGAVAVAGNAAGFILSSQPHEKVTNFRRFEPVDGRIGRVFQPQLEIVFVTAECVGAEAFGGFVLQEARNGLGQKQGA